MNLADTAQGAVRALIANRCNTAATCAEGTSVAKSKTTATATFTINGIFYSKAATDDLSMSTGHTKLLSGYTQLFILALDASGNASTYQGMAFKAETDVDGTTKYRGYNTDTVNGTVRHIKSAMLEPYMSAFLPTNVPDTVCPIGITKIVASADFTPGTTDWGTQDTTVDIGVVPANCNF